MLFTFSFPAHAHDERGHDYGVISVDIPEIPAVDEYSRIGASVRFQTNAGDPSRLEICNPETGVTCRNFVPGTVQPLVEMTCAGNAAHPGSGGWRLDSSSGECWKGLQICYGDGSPGNCADVPGSPPVPSLAPYSKCAAPDRKGACVYGGAGLRTVTSDDMFRLEAAGRGYLDLTPVGDITEPLRLKWLERADGADAAPLMIPSGPPGSYEDYRNFAQNPPDAYVRAEEACYPVKVTLCGALETRPSLAGACGEAHGRPAPARPDSGLCRTGTPSVVSGAGPWEWTCAGWEGGVAASCSAPLFMPPPVFGVCGSAHGAAVPEAPVADLCSSGEATLVTGSGPWHWRCAGQYGGTDASCEALHFSDPAVDGACGVAHGASYPGTPVPPAGILCATGAVSGLLWGDADPAVPGSGHWYWSCLGYDGGSDANYCKTLMYRPPVDGVCGTAQNVPSATKPQANLCQSGPSSAVSGGAVPPDWMWIWTCGGAYGGKAAQCKVHALVESPPVDGVCGSAHGVAASAKPIVGLCRTGTPSTVSAGIAWGWTCSGTGGGRAASCSAPMMGVSPPPSCGPAHGVATAVTPSGGLCNVGTASSVTGVGPWSWNCASGGQIAACSAPKTVTVRPGQCGPANGMSGYPAPSLLCAVGNASAVTGTGPWRWTCTPPGGTSVSCQSNNVETGYGCAPVCGPAKNRPTTTKPVAGLCESTTQPCSVSNPQLSTNGQYWNWLCSGSDGTRGITVSCSAPNEAP